LEEENHQLKELVANFTLDSHILKNILAKKRIKPAEMRRIAEKIQQTYQLSERRTCRLLDFGRSSKRYVPVDMTKRL
jgi:hypothetical protein